jgi:hypothetical protein
MGFSLAKTATFERLRAVFSRPHDAPLFVFGQQKAGTSAIAGLLCAATGEPLVRDFRGAREPHLGRLLRGELPVARFVSRNAWAFSMPIVKEPSLTFVAPALLDHFPKARAVFITRDPWANIRSILGRQRLSGDADLPVRGNGARPNKTWQSILSGRDLGLAPDHFIGILARRWVRAADICEQLGDRVVAVRYEDFNRDKANTINRLVAGVGMTPRNDISALLDHPFQRSGQSKESIAEFFGANLSRINDICADRAARLGYAVPNEADARIAAE